MGSVCVGGYLLKASEIMPTVAKNELKRFLESVVGFLRILDPRTGKPAAGNEEARAHLNVCRAIAGVLPFERDIPFVPICLQDGQEVHQHKGS
jgi:hypothetical protein